ncbi:hypothetical protein ZWY2020_013919 [Hordeum vulgare]|nr:hypothetical protein ZWY2020_013919 [Hordeum vulgare]
MQFMPCGNLPLKFRPPKRLSHPQQGFVNEYKEVRAHGNTKLHMIHTNDKKHMATSHKEYKRHLGLQRHKIVGINLEYTNEPNETQKPALVQLSVGKTQPMLLFELSTAEHYTIFDNFLADPRYTFASFSIGRDKTRLERVNLEVANFIDIHKEWRVPEATKELDSLADVASMLVDDYYNDMKKKITDEEHRCFARIAPIAETCVYVDGLELNKSVWHTQLGCLLIPNKEF